MPKHADHSFLTETVNLHNGIFPQRKERYRKNMKITSFKSKPLDILYGYKMYFVCYVVV